jgi:hypothetical protein
MRVGSAQLTDRRQARLGAQRDLRGRQAAGEQCVEEWIRLVRLLQLDNGQQPERRDAAEDL